MTWGIYNVIFYRKIKGCTTLSKHHDRLWSERHRYFLCVFTISCGWSQEIVKMYPLPTSIKCICHLLWEIVVLHTPSTVADYYIAKWNKISNWHSRLYQCFWINHSIYVYKSRHWGKSSAVSKLLSYRNWRPNYCPPSICKVIILQ